MKRKKGQGEKRDDEERKGGAMNEFWDNTR